MAFNAIGLFGRYQDTAIKATLTQIRSHLEARGNVVFLGDTTHQEIDGLRISNTGRSIEESIDLGIVVGGDGTMLHVANGLLYVRASAHVQDLSRWEVPGRAASGQLQGVR